VSKRLPFALFAVLSIAAAPSSALAGPRDIVATRTYIRANYALVRAGGRAIGQSEAAVKGLMHQVRAECLGVATGSPQGEDSDKLDNELQGAITILALRPVTGAVGTFVRAVAHLRWSSPQLTRAVSSYAGKLRTLSSLTPPAVCADVRAWTASHFATLAPGTDSFDAVFENVNVTLGEVPAELLAPYERRAEKAMLRASARLEEQLAEAENRAVPQWEDTLQEIGVSP
jgi:hypothetical protein